jgi:hypothetical protein
MNIFFVFIPILFYAAICAAFIYVVYRMVDGWVNKSLSVRQEQNELLAKLIDTLNTNKS